MYSEALTLADDSDTHTMWHYKQWLHLPIYKYSINKETIKHSQCSACLGRRVG